MLLCIGCRTRKQLECCYAWRWRWATVLPQSGVHLLSPCSWRNLHVLRNDSCGRIPLSDACSLKFCSFTREMLQSSSFQGKSVVIAEQIRTEEAKWREIRATYASIGYVRSSVPSFCCHGLVKQPGLHWTPAHYLDQSETAIVQALGSLCSLGASGYYLLEQLRWIKPLHSSLALLTPLMMVCESTLLPPGIVEPLCSSKLLFGKWQHLQQWRGR